MAKPSAQGDKSCSTCKFWAHEDGAEQGVCQRFPQSWATSSDYWCGEYNEEGVS